MLSIEEISLRLQKVSIMDVAKETKLSYNTIKALRAGQRGAHGKTIERLTEYFSGTHTGTTAKAE